jgi:hypothetical protein
MKTPVEVLLAIVAIGGRLDSVGDGRLRMLLPPDCPTELKNASRQHKAALLEWLRLNFLVILSEALHATLLWTPDEATKEPLAAAGADLGSIYTAPELGQSVHRRVATGGLPLLHAAKRRCNGKLTEP